MSAPYLLSKTLDPLFAVLIGTSAAYLRIRRDAVAADPASTPHDTWAELRRRVGAIDVRSWDWRGVKKVARGEMDDGRVGKTRAWGVVDP